MSDHNGNLPVEWRLKYLGELEKHLKYFEQAAVKLGVPEQQIMIHDVSKESNAEFPAYVRKFGGGVKDDEEWNAAWLHHIKSNPHHWQHWIIPGGRGRGGTPIPMPLTYVTEMVADWMGSSRAYTKKWNMTDWLGKHYYSILVHPETRAHLDKMLDKLGYDLGAILMASKGRR